MAGVQRVAASRQQRDHRYSRLWHASRDTRSREPLHQFIYLKMDTKVAGGAGLPAASGASAAATASPLAAAAATLDARDDLVALHELLVSALDQPQMTTADGLLTSVATKTAAQIAAAAKAGAAASNGGNAAAAGGAGSATDMTGTELCKLANLQLLAPRGRFALCPTASKASGQAVDVLHFVGKSKAFGVALADITHIAHVERPSAMKKTTSHVFVLRVSKPVQWGKQKLRCICLQTQSSDAPLDCSIAGDVAPSELSASLSGPPHVVLAGLFGALLPRVRMSVPDKAVFASSAGADSVKAYYRVDDGLLYPMKDGLLFVQKPVLFLPLLMIKSFGVNRGGGGGARSFDVTVSISNTDDASNVEGEQSGDGKDAAESHTFSMIAADELERVQQWGQLWKRKVDAAIDRADAAAVKSAASAATHESTAAGHDAAAATAASAPPQAAEVVIGDDSDSEDDGSSFGSEDMESDREEDFKVKEGGWKSSDEDSDGEEEEDDDDESDSDGDSDDDGSGDSGSGDVLILDGAGAGAGAGGGIAAAAASVATPSRAQPSNEPIVLDGADGNAPARAVSRKAEVIDLSDTESEGHESKKARVAA